MRGWSIGKRALACTRRVLAQKGWYAKRVRKRTPKWTPKWTLKWTPKGLKNVLGTRFLGNSHITILHYLTALFGVPGVFCNTLRHFWGSKGNFLLKNGPPWVTLVPPCGTLGAPLGLYWAPLGHHWAPLGHPWAALRLHLTPLGYPWGSSLGVSEPILA